MLDACADGPYWKGEIDAALKAASALTSAPQPDALYLRYATDKHQSSPEFLTEFSENLRQNCDDYCDVVVNLRTGERYFAGEWKPVEGWAVRLAAAAALPSAAPLDLEDDHTRWLREQLRETAVEMQLTNPSLSGRLCDAARQLLRQRDEIRTLRAGHGDVAPQEK